MKLFKKVFAWFFLSGIEETIKEIEKGNNDFIAKANKFLKRDSIKEDYRRQGES